MPSPPPTHTQNPVSQGTELNYVTVAKISSLKVMASPNGQGTNMYLVKNCEKC